MKENDRGVEVYFLSLLFWIFTGEDQRMPNGYYIVSSTTELLVLLPIYALSIPIRGHGGGRPVVRTWLSSGIQPSFAAKEKLLPGPRGNERRQCGGEQKQT